MREDYILDDKTLLKETLVLAQKGRGQVSPNPEVGCIIIKNKRVIGRGFHEQFGGAHAEVNAILDAEKNGFLAEGATVFVSLEPCSHCSPHKKTPPCADLLIHKKIKKVVIFYQDPNPEVAGAGAKKLKNAGIEVVWASENFPELYAQYQNFYKKFTYWIQNNTPFITLKLAVSQDNFLGKKSEKTKISGEECRDYTLEQRDMHQAIVVGGNTVKVDNPTLSGKKTEPTRVILDSRSEFAVLSPEERKKYGVFRDENYLLISGKKSVPEILEIVAQKNISSLFIEGGGKTAQKFLESGRVHDYIQYVSPNFLASGVPGICIAEFSSFVLRNEFFLGEDEVKIFENKE